MSKKDIGIIGMGVMGRSIARNMGSNGIELALFNRYIENDEVRVAQKVIAQYEELRNASGFEDLKAFVADLKRPRKILLMINAGTPVDDIIQQLTPLLEPGDVVMDGGNSYYKDTKARVQQLCSYEMHYLGIGISGGESGALKGPSIMPGGTKIAFDLVRPYLEKIAAKDHLGGICCTYIGSDASGHFVKMIHNGIEYAEMQLLAEVYGILKNVGKFTHPKIGQILHEWLKTDADSYLLYITANILQERVQGKPILNTILDVAGNKGTGSWSTQAACEYGIPATMLSAALFARYTSSFYEDRLRAAQYLEIESISKPKLSLDDLYHAYRSARIINHHQGFHLIAKASEDQNWNVDLSELARIWTNGCIIRSRLMEKISTEIDRLDQILLLPAFYKQVQASLGQMKKISTVIVNTSVSAPCFLNALDFAKAYSQKRSTAHIIQAQRDYFGAHRYKKKDDPDGPSHHHLWKAP